MNDDRLTIASATPELLPHYLTQHDDTHIALRQLRKSQKGW